MEEGVTSDVTQAPAAAVTKINNDNNNVVKRPSAPAATTNKKTCDNKPVNKPNQGWKNPTNASNMHQNVTKPKQQLPDYIRTEMEILRHLSRVNRNLRILLTPKCEHTPYTTPRQKYYQVIRQRAGGVGQRVGGVNYSKKSQNFLTKANATKSKSVVLKQIKPPISTSRVTAVGQAESRGTPKKRMEVRLEAQETGKNVPKTSKRPLQRLILYFKPKPKDDHFKGASQSKSKQSKVVNKTVKEVKTESAIKCKTKMNTQKQVKQTQAKISEQNNKGQSKKAEMAVKELEEFKEKLKAKDGKKVTDKLKVEETRKLKQETGGEAESGKLKQKLTEKVPQKLTVKLPQKLTVKLPQKLFEKEPPKQQTAQAQMTLSQSVKRGKTIKQKMLGLGLKCLRKAKEGKVMDDKNKLTKTENQNTIKPTTAPTTAATTAATAIETVPHKAPAPIEQVESALMAGKFGNCLRFFKSHKKVSVPQDTESTEESVLNYEMQQKKMQKLRISTNLATDDNGTAQGTSLGTYPAYSYVNMKYMKNLKASKEKEARATSKNSILVNAQNRKIYKDPHATPSTSSLEEYFRVLSERMAREQKEADERKPLRRHSRRGINNNISHFNYKRAQPTIQRQYNRQRRDIVW